MKKIKSFVALGLVLCGIVGNSISTSAAVNACSHSNTRDIGTHMSHWQEKHYYTVLAESGDIILKQCIVSWNVDRVSRYCDDCRNTLWTEDRETEKHDDCGSPTYTWITRR